MNAHYFSDLDEAGYIDSKITDLERRETIEAIFLSLCPYYDERLRAAIVYADRELGANLRFTGDWFNKVAQESGYLHEKWTPWELSGEDPNGGVILAPCTADALKIVIQKGVTLDKELSELSNYEVVQVYERRLDRVRFFSRDEVRPDYAYWRRLKVWSTEETVALSLDKDPRRVNALSLRQYSRSPFAIEFRRRLAEADRAIELGELQKGISRVELKWLFSRMAIEVPANFHTNLLTFVDDDGPKPTIHHLTKRALEDLILAMAVEKYGYDPAAKENGTALNAILADLQANGLRTSPSSIRNKLNEAWRHTAARDGLKGKLKDANGRLIRPPKVVA